MAPWVMRSLQGNLCPAKEVSTAMMEVHLVPSGWFLLLTLSHRHGVHYDLVTKANSCTNIQTHTHTYTVHTHMYTQAHTHMHADVHMFTYLYRQACSHTLYFQRCTLLFLYPKTSFLPPLPSPTPSHTHANPKGHRCVRLEWNGLEPGQHQDVLHRQRPEEAVVIRL